MKVTDLQRYAILFTLGATLSVTDVLAFPAQQQQQQSSSISEDKVAANIQSPTAPGFTPGEANDQSQGRVTMRVGAPIRNSASSSDFGYGPQEDQLASEWFRNPSVFAETSYTTSNDRRRFGVDSDQVAIQAGFDFETKSDFILGLMYSPTFNNGRIDDLGAGALGGITDVETESHFVTLYLARPINEFFFAGATFTGGTTHTKTELQQSGFAVPTAGVITKTDSDIVTLSPSVFVGFSQTFDTFAISTTASYLYSESYWDISDNSGVRPTPASFSRSTGTFTWLMQGTYFLTDSIDVSLSHKLTQIVHTNNYLPLGANNGEHDHNWSTIGLDLNWILSQSVSLYGGMEYDVFNRNYQETITGTLGLSCNF